MCSLKVMLHRHQQAWLQCRQLACLSSILITPELHYSALISHSITELFKLFTLIINQLLGTHTQSDPFQPFPSYCWLSWSLVAVFWFAPFCRSLDVVKQVKTLRLRLCYCFCSLDLSSFLISVNI